MQKTISDQLCSVGKPNGDVNCADAELCARLYGNDDIGAAPCHHLIATGLLASVCMLCRRKYVRNELQLCPFVLRNSLAAAGLHCKRGAAVCCLLLGSRRWAALQARRSCVLSAT